MDINISKKKAIIFAPHQDDEINIAGGLISCLLANKIELKVVYSTNGDYCTKASTRIKECKKSLNILGLEENNIYFMGYSDQAREENNHLYMTQANEIWKSKKNITETYHPFSENEVAMMYDNEHHKFNKENFIKDIISILEDFKPDYIYCIDLDSHPDHRALSLGVEYAIGKLINKINNYKPIVYKSFAYPTFYFGLKDLNDINIKSTTFKTEKYSYCDMQNPYYSWKDRIRFPLCKNTHNKFLLNNKVYKALKCHKSQCIVGRAFSTINGDQIFWQRRTDNLLNNSKIEVTSGKKEKLRDFMLYDIKDIMQGNSKKIKFDSNAWIPNKNDKNPEINITFDKIKNVSEINLYHTIENKSNISKIELSADDNFTKIFELNILKNNISKISFNNLITKHITIRILKKNDDNSGFSEIEIFEKKKRDIQFIKLEINGDFAYKYYYDNENIKIYSYDGYSSRYLDENEYDIISDSIELKEGKFLLKKRKNKIKIQLKNNKEVFDETIIIRKSIFSKLLNTCINCINCIIVATSYSKQKVIRKIKRIMKIN